MPRRSRRSVSTRSRSASRRLTGCVSRTGARLAQPPHQLLGLADGQPLPDHGPEDVGLALDAEPAERPPVPLREAAVGDRGLDIRVEVEQAQRVGDGRARLADALGDALLGEPELVDELAVGEGLVDRVEVGALDVLDERDLELVAIRELADERRDALEAREPGGAHAALAGDELVAVERLGDEDRLQHAVLADARGELLEAGVVDVAPRLVRVRRDPGERDLDHGRGRLRALRDQRGEPAAERRRARSALTVMRRSPPACRSRDRSSSGRRDRIRRPHAPCPARPRARTSRASCRYASAPFDSGR